MNDHTIMVAMQAASANHISPLSDPFLRDYCARDGLHSERFLSTGALDYLHLSPQELFWVYTGRHPELGK